MSRTSIGAVIQALNIDEPAVRTEGSPYDKLHHIEEHNHSPSLCYPTLVDGVPVTAGAAGPPWVLGAFTEIVPALAIGDEFDIHFISIEDLDDVTVYELHLYYGAGDTFCGSVRFTKTANLEGTQNVNFMTPLIPADSRIRAKLASDAGGSIATISIMYHTY